MPEAATTGTIAITRVFAAPRELVWQAFTEPEQLACWWGKRGWSAPLETIAVDLRPGGVFSIVGINDDDGRTMPTNAIFREVVAPERLVIAEAGRDDCHEGAVTTIAFTDLGDGRTVVDLRVRMHAPEATRRSAEAGLSSALHRLAETLEAR
jgi:uncharacterized protein YndB with AHSA1/START domain